MLQNYLKINHLRYPVSHW